jgi:hypothetical protein
MRYSHVMDRPTVSVTERFWAHVNKDGPTMPGMDSPCWEWTGSVRAEGYGVMGYPNSRGTEQTHRVSWEINIGPIPPGLFVLHHCDNRRCVRAETDPTTSHLFVGTQRENLLDMARKGRHRGAKLTPDLVRGLRGRYVAGESLNALAASTGYAKRTVHQALIGATWSHVPGAITLRSAPIGDSHVGARLTRTTVIELRRRYCAGESCATLSTELGVHYNTVEAAIKGKTWGHVPGAVALGRSRRAA